jgi:hypothetical protein
MTLVTGNETGQVSDAMDMNYYPLGVRSVATRLRAVSE